MILLRYLGGLFVVIGAIGIVVPVWPTTLFWIVAAVCFTRSSPTARDWIYRQPGIGLIVEEFVEHGAMSRKSKYSASVGMLLFGGASAYLLRSSNLVLATLLVVLTLGLIYVWTRPQSSRNSETKLL